MEIIAKQTFLIDAKKVSINNLKIELREFLKQSGFEYEYGRVSLIDPKFIEIAKSKTLLTGRCRVYFNIIGEGANPNYSVTIICFDHDEMTIKSSPIRTESISNTDKNTLTILEASMTMVGSTISYALSHPEIFSPDKNEARIKEDDIAGKIHSFLCDKDAFIRCPKCGKIVSKITQQEYHEDNKTWVESAAMAVAAVAVILGTGGHGSNGHWRTTQRTRNTYVKYKSYPCGCEWSKLKDTKYLNIWGNEW